MLTSEIVIESITRTLIKEGAEKVILFGSYAYGSPTKDSDIDILVIKDIPENETRNFRIKMKKALWNSLKNPQFSFDVLVDNEQRIQKRILMGDLFYKEILLKGKVLYA
jgi:predicted nucleotidyltransferase